MNHTTDKASYSINDYVEEVQDALIDFSIPEKKVRVGKSKIDTKEATFLLFEILKYNKEENKSFFFSHVSKSILPRGDEDSYNLARFNNGLKRVLADDETAYRTLFTKWPTVLTQQAWPNAATAREALKELLGNYENSFLISDNLGATALIYRAWMQNKLDLLWGKEASDVSAQSIINALYRSGEIEGLSINSIFNEMARLLDLTDDNGSSPIINESFFDGKLWVTGYDDDEYKRFIAFEKAFIHKYADKSLTDDYKHYYLVHYPLVLDGYWFIGFAWFLKLTNQDDESADLFQSARYPICLNLLIKTVAPSLKKALLHNALVDFDWSNNRNDSLFAAVRKYFPCFKVRQSLGFDFPLLLNKFAHYDTFECILYIPKWVNAHSSTIHEEVQRLLDEINKIEQERRAIQKELLNDMAATFSHAYLKIGEAIKQMLPNCDTDRIIKDVEQFCRTTVRDETAKKQILGKLALLGVSSKEPITRSYDYFYRGVENFYYSILISDRIPTLKASSTSALSLRDLLSSIFQNLFLPLAPYILRTDSAYRKLASYYSSFNRDIGDCLSLSNLDKVLLKAPDFSTVNHDVTEQERLKDVYSLIRETAILELFINAFSNDALGAQECSTSEYTIVISFDSDRHILSFSNFVAQDAIKLASLESTHENSLRQWPIDRPSVSKGNRGWGLFGVRTAIEHVLKIGNVARYYDVAAHRGTIQIQFNRDWLLINE